MTRSIVLKAFAIALIGAFTSTVAGAQEFMTQKELLTTIPGQTLYGLSNADNKTKWAQVYSKGRKKGRITGVFGDTQYKSKWFVKEDFWCENWDGGQGCWKFVQVGEKQLRAYKDGKRKLENSWRIK